MFDWPDIKVKNFRMENFRKNWRIFLEARDSQSSETDLKESTSFQVMSHYLLHKLWPRLPVRCPFDPRNLEAWTSLYQTDDSYSP